jgi:hypothetical protein
MSILFQDLKNGHLILAIRSGDSQQPGKNLYLGQKPNKDILAKILSSEEKNT